MDEKEALWVTLLKTVIAVAVGYGFYATLKLSGVI
jgi:hypothetical protein